jgi:hypothetical protein
MTAVPAPIVHDLFASHTDAAENHCRYYHKDLGCHLEEQQEHCDLFKTNTPLYDALAVGHVISLYVTCGADYKSIRPCPVSWRQLRNLPARAPPTA